MEQLREGVTKVNIFLVARDESYAHSQFHEHK